MSLAKNIDLLRRLQKAGVEDAQVHALRAYSPTGRPTNVLSEHMDFGSNPGNLRMLSFVPENVAGRPALLVALHGCGQDPIGYDLGAGWSALAARYGFALLMPGQMAANNPNACFSWFNADDTTRDHGEVLSIRQMIAAMVQHHRIDTDRIFITGLSAGGAMANAMLASYPEVFAAGAIIAGLPFGLASNVRQALSLMMKPRPHTAGNLGDRIRRASPHHGPWPRISIWQGASDQTVNPANADELLKQWLDVHGLPLAPMSQSVVDGQSHQVWWDAEGTTIVESYTIAGLAHGTPIGLGNDDQPYGEPGPFMIDAGISSTWHIATFFGLTGHPVAMPKTPVQDAPTIREPAVQVLEPLPRPAAKRAPKQQPVNVGDIINRALTAAGLIKR